MSTVAGQPPIIVPDGYVLHTENTTHLLLPSSDEAFLNPVQEFNRDLSVACIRVWTEEVNKEKEAKWRIAQTKKATKPSGEPQKKRLKDETAPPAANPEVTVDSDIAVKDNLDAAALPSVEEEPQDVLSKEYHPYKAVILEALSATGLRSIRYAKEIPLVRYVIANDLSPAATAAMRRNIEVNGLGVDVDAVDGPDPAIESGEGAPKKRRLPKVRVNEGDACTLMYNHRTSRSRVDVVDLDPYGTAAPFIDAAVQSVNEGGLLCVTCTDLQVLATTNYPEKCYAMYGGTPLKAEYCHEAALRLVLHSISTAASRYGRYIKPLLSLSIDFYVRLFIRVESSPMETKKAASKTSIYYICSGCQSFYEQPMQKVVEREPKPLLFKVQSGPTAENRCPECASVLHLAGPMWSAPLHDPHFVSRVLDHVEENPSSYGTSPRMKGMLSVAKEELDTSFYFTPAKISSFFHCVCPSLDEIASALLHGGHKIARSHACPGSLKTTATREDIYDIFRSWVKTHPVRMDKVSDSSPTKVLLSKEPRAEANFTRHPESVTGASQVKVVRYQENPTSHWGPGKKATSSGTKRKRDGA